MAGQGTLPQYQYVLYGVLSILEFLFGTPLNAACLAYFFFKQDRSNSRFLYLWINSVDVIQCLSSLFTAITCFYWGEDIVFRYPVICTVYGVIWNTGPRLSVFLIAVLSVSRAISLVYPLKEIKRRYIAVPIVLYTAILVVQATFHLWFGASYVYIPTYIGCVWQLKDLGISREMAEILWVMLIAAEFLVPAIPITVSCIVSCVKLRRSDPLIDNSMSDRKRRATITIVMLTGAYVLLNIPTWLLILGHGFYHLSYFEWDLEAMFKLDTNQIYLMDNLAFTHTVTLNSVANSFIYLWRIRDLRNFVTNAIRNPRTVLSLND